MRRYNTHYTDKEDLDEGIKSALSFFKRSISRIVNSASRGLSALKPGKKHVMKFSIPLTISEAKQKQTGKKGGELAEVALLDKLYDKLVAHKGLNKSSVKFKGHSSREDWKKTAYKKNLDSYRKQEGSNTRKKEDVWIKHGYAGAEEMYQRMVSNIGRDKMSLCSFELIHLGKDEEGSSKIDFSVSVQMKSSKEIVDMLNISLKATEKGTPFDTPSNGLQTSWEKFILSLTSGKYLRELDFQTRTKYEKHMDKFAKTGKQMWFDRAQEVFVKTPEYQLDKLGEEIGYKWKGKNLSDFMAAAAASFEAQRKSGGKNAPANIVKAAEVNQDEYYNVIIMAVEQKLKTHKDEMIEGVLRLGGVESDLDYISLGIDPSDEVTSAAVSTLYNEKYTDLIKTLTAKQKDNLDAKIEIVGRSPRFMIFDKRTPRKSLITFNIYKEVNNARIQLPTFETNKVKRSGAPKYDKLLDKFATSAPTDKKYVSFPALHDLAMKKIFAFVKKNKIDLNDIPTALAKKVTIDVANGSSVEDAFEDNSLGHLLD